MKKVKPKTQTQKEIDKIRNGNKYNAGVGLYLSENTFGLLGASPGEYGGVRYSWDDAQDSGLTSPDGMMLKSATAERLGGIRVGNGLVPELQLDAEGYYQPTKYVGIRLYGNGNGLQFADDDELSEDLKEQAENKYGGKALSLKLGWGLAIDNNGAVYVTSATAGEASISAGKGVIVESSKDSSVISVRLGDGLGFDESGAIKTTSQGGSGGSYAAGSGITIEEGEENSTISVNIGEGLEIGDDGAVKALINADNSIIIQAADEKILLHEYEVVEFINGNKKVFAGPYNQIVGQNMVIHKLGSTAPNGVAVQSWAGVATPDELPDVPVYWDVSIDPPATVSGVANVDRITWEITAHYTDYVEFTVYAHANGVKNWIANDVNYLNADSGFGFAWTSIAGPNDTYPYGGINCEIYGKYRRNPYFFFTQFRNYNCFIPFRSEAEYNAAVGLTSEPQTLIKVEETVTEVTENE